MNARFTAAVALAAALTASLAAGAAAAADNDAGVPLRPGDAPGPWTLASHGRAVCVIQLTDRRVGNGFAVRVPPRCGSALPRGPLAWRPTGGGMALLGAGGAVLHFGRWSDSLLVSGQRAGQGLELRRGRDHPDSY